MAELILCVGRLKEAYWRDACGEYMKRLTRYVKPELTEVADLPEPEHASDADRQKIMQKEGEALLRRIRPADHVVALCIDAPQVTSEGLADLLKERDRLGGRTVFVIGGASIYAQMLPYCDKLYLTEVEDLKKLTDELMKYEPSEIICNDAFLMSGMDLEK